MTKSQEKPSNRHHSKGSIFALIILAIFFLSGVILYLKPDLQNEIIQTIGRMLDTNNSFEDYNDYPREIIEEPTTTDNKMFYIKDNNIYSYDIEEQRIDKWTLYSTNRDFLFPHLTVIDEKNIGYSRCDTDNFRCQILTLNLDTKTSKEEFSFDTGEKLLDVGFAEGNLISYITETDDSKELYLYQNDILSKIEQFEIEGYSHDKNYVNAPIKFSFNHKYLFVSVHDTDNEKESYIFVYNLEDETVDIIPNAIEGIWIDNRRIAYKTLNDENEMHGIYVYTIPEKESLQIELIPNEAHYPQLSFTKPTMLYTLYDQSELWAYDTSTYQARLVSKDAINGYFIDPFVLVYSKVEECNDSTACNETNSYKGKKFKNIEIYYIDSDEITDTFSDEINTLRTASTNKSF